MSLAMLPNGSLRALRARGVPVEHRRGAGVRTRAVHSSASDRKATGVDGRAPEGALFGPDYTHPTRNLALELVRVTEAAALSSARWLGKGDKHAADAAAVEVRQTAARVFALMEFC